MNQLLIELAGLSVNSYNGEYGFIQVASKNIFDKKIEHTEFSFYELDAETLAIVFQGSNQWRDWFDNFHFEKLDVKSIQPYGNTRTNIKIHEGFYNNYHAARDTILSILAGKPYDNIKKIICTGHSLGGALAQLCAVDVQYNMSERFKEFQCVTFGSPRVGNVHFCVSLRKRVAVVNYKNRRDIVTNVPFEVFGYMTANEKKISSPENNPITGFSVFGNWKDHYPIRYYRAMKKEYK